MINTVIEVMVIPDPEYHYKVSVNDIGESGIYYLEEDKLKAEITFGSFEEMEKVAQAMLRAVDAFREM